MFMSCLLTVGARPQKLDRGSIHVRVFQANGEFIRVLPELISPSKYNEGPTFLMPASEKGQEVGTGEYEFEVVPGEYYVRANPPGFARTYFPGTSNPTEAKAIRVGNGEHVSVDIHLSTSPRFRITGRIIDSVPDRQPHHFSGVSLSSSSLTVREYKYEAAFKDIPFCCAVNRVPDEDVSISVLGDRFEINNVRAGDYELTASVLVGDVEFGKSIPILPGKQPPFYVRYRGRIPVKVTNRDIDDIKVEVTHGTDLTGSIVSSGGTMDANMTSVQLGGPDFDFDSWQFAEVDKKGLFEFPNLLEGEYRLSIGVLPGRAYVDEIFHGKATIPDAKGLTPFSNAKFKVGRSGTESLRIIARTDGGTVSGQVESGEEALIFLLPSETSARFDMYHLVYSKPTGSFEFVGGIPPGSYRIYAIRKGPSNPIMVSKLSQSWGRIEPQGSPVTVKRNERVKVRLNLIDSE
jgi:hypothetical protein